LAKEFRLAKMYGIGNFEFLRKKRARHLMKILVTAGNTQTPIDRVRCITNIFSGRTGAQIAASAFERGHDVVLLTSNPEVLESIPAKRERKFPEWRLITYRTFDDLEVTMSEEISDDFFAAIIHAAAVSDYQPVGVFALAPGTTFDPDDLAWDSTTQRPHVKDVSRGKVKSSHPELWLRLIPTPKLVDKIRADWGFKGLLVKFKLEVGLSEAELIEGAERARLHSNADLITANTLEGMNDWAIIGSGANSYQKVPRNQLAEHLLNRLEELRS
jgi:phosphopantothenate---cysteine ligase (CTP)